MLQFLEDDHRRSFAEDKAIGRDELRVDALFFRRGLLDAGDRDDEAVLARATIQRNRLLTRHEGVVALTAHEGLEIPDGIGANVRTTGLVLCNIDVNGSPNAQLSVLSRAHVEGDISAQKAVVDGVVTGNIASTGRVELHAGAKVKGNISYATMAIEHGAKLYGMMTSTETVRDSEPT